MCARRFFCSQNRARPGFSEPKTATLASYAAGIVELSLFINKMASIADSFNVITEGLKIEAPGDEGVEAPSLQPVSSPGSAETKFPPPATMVWTSY